MDGGKKNVNTQGIATTIKQIVVRVDGGQNTDYSEEHSNDEIMKIKNIVKENFGVEPSNINIS